MMKTNTEKKNNVAYSPVTYDSVSKMSQPQLELAWLGSIVEEPRRIRGQYGLLGLDRSMFVYPIYFDLGQLCLKEDFESSAEMSSELLEKFMQERLLSKLMQNLNNMEFLPAFYQQYSREIEKRAKRDYSIPWTQN